MFKALKSELEIFPTFWMMLSSLLVMVLSSKAEHSFYAFISASLAWLLFLIVGYSAYLQTVQLKKKMKEAKCRGRNPKFINPNEPPSTPQ